MVPAGEGPVTSVRMVSQVGGGLPGRQALGAFLFVEVPLLPRAVSEPRELGVLRAQVGIRDLQEEEEEHRVRDSPRLHELFLSSHVLAIPCQVLRLKAICLRQVSHESQVIEMYWKLLLKGHEE